MSLMTQRLLHGPDDDLRDMHKCVNQPLLRPTWPSKSDFKNDLALALEGFRRREFDIPTRPEAILSPYSTSARQ